MVAGSQVLFCERFAWAEDSADDVLLERLIHAFAQRHIAAAFLRLDHPSVFQSRCVRKHSSYTTKKHWICHRESRDIGHRSQGKPTTALHGGPGGFGAAIPGALNDGRSPSLSLARHAASAAYRPSSLYAEKSFHV